MLSALFLVTVFVLLPLAVFFGIAALVFRWVLGVRKNRDIQIQMLKELATIREKLLIQQQVVIKEQIVELVER